MPCKKFDRSQLPAHPNLVFEQEQWNAGHLCVAGVDEAGRGPLAGPVSAAVVILPADLRVGKLLHGVRDSKQMTAGEREEWSVRIRGACLYWAVGVASNEEIDSLGIVPATRLAVMRAIEQIACRPDHLLVDFLALPGCTIPQTALVKGDARSLSIAAASVLAKTARDAWMMEADRTYPGYGFAAHKGYGTPAHLHALERLGPCAIHRRSFGPVRAKCEKRAS